MTKVISEIDLNLNYLQTEIARLDLRLRRQIRYWQNAGQNPADAFRGLYISDEEVTALLDRPLGGNWGQLATLDAAEVSVFERIEGEIDRRLAALIETARQQDVSLRLLALSEIFELDRFEVETLLICLSPTFDLRYERLYAYLQDDVTHKRPGINLILDLLCPAGAERLHHLTYFTDEARLFSHRFLIRMADNNIEQPLLNQTLMVDNALAGWLLGHNHLPTELADQAKLVHPQSIEADSLLTAEICLALTFDSSDPALIVFYGPDQVAQDVAARFLAVQQQRPLFQLNVAAVTKTEADLHLTLRLVFREARLANAIPYLYGWDSCLVDETIPPNLLQMVCEFPDWVIIAGQTHWQATGFARDRRLVWVEFSLPDYTRRLALWHHFLGEADAAETFDLAALAGQFILTTGQIRDAVASARDLAAQARQPLQNDDLFIAVRSHSNPRLSTLARKIVPRYGWSDIVLPTDQIAILSEIVNTVRGRSLVLEEWGVGRKLASSKGVTVLFAGPPGTGKTMAAEIIARELGLDLYKIDLSTVVSKYIGETEKNLERIFHEASSSNAILFFDEADAIFGKRSEVKDAHDRYANIETSYLLQRMEAYDGVTMLATNLRANLDEAFTRRLQFAVDFPFPEKVDRLRIWQTLFPPDVPTDPNIDFEFLAGRFKLAGGNIRNILISAAYLAATDGKKVTMAHLLHGTRRELQKMGRLIGDETLRYDS